MEKWDDILRSMADDPDDFEQQGGLAIFRRHGNEYTLTLKNIPGDGLSVFKDSPGKGVETSHAPISTYIQRDILGLPRLAAQISRVLSRTWKERPVRYVEGPAQRGTKKSETESESAAKDMLGFLKESEPDTTRIIQLMGIAGQGKTALLEHLALEFANEYTPNPFPTPIMLPVDLLGRYVGTIEDAIAGSLNNTYLFPGLSQKDVILCIRHGWLILALDGFDELVARVGVRDAFLRISELLEQLKASGTVIISARESFFELYQIAAAIRSYIQLKEGCYSTTVVKLLPWTNIQGVQVFKNLGSSSAEEDLSALLKAFHGDNTIVLHPFFLTRLADLWQKGERFAEAGKEPDELTRAKYVIETFIQREAREKWIDRDGNPLLTSDQHTRLLGIIAEEMWCSGAFKLNLEEIKVTTDIALTELEVPQVLWDTIREHIPTHAVFTAKDRVYSFAHDQFLIYFLSHRLAEILRSDNLKSAALILSVRGLGPALVDLACWKWRALGLDLEQAVKVLTSIRKSAKDSTLDANVAQLCGRLLKSDPSRGKIVIDRFTFSGDFLAQGDYSQVTFTSCNFWQMDFSASTFKDCVFKECKFVDVQIGRGTDLAGAKFIDCGFTSINVEGELSLFSPNQINTELERRKAIVQVTDLERVITESKAEIPLEVLKCIEKYLKESERTCDVAVEEMEHRFGEFAPEIAKIGLRAGVFKKIDKHPSGPKMTFVRFKVRRDLLLGAQRGNSGDKSIDSFWEEVEKRYSEKR